MARLGRRGLSDEEKAEVWKRWHMGCDTPDFCGVRDGIALLHDQCHGFVFKLFRVLLVTACLRHH